MSVACAVLVGIAGAISLTHSGSRCFAAAAAESPRSADDSDKLVFKRVSIPVDGGQSRGATVAARVSRDGRYVMFVNDGNNMAPDLSAGRHAYWQDLEAGKTVLLKTLEQSAQSEGRLLNYDLMPDGMHVVEIRSAAAEGTRTPHVVVRPVNAEGASAAPADFPIALNFDLPGTITLLAALNDSILVRIEVGSSHKTYLMSLKDGALHEIGEHIDRAFGCDDGSRVAFATAASLSRKDTNNVSDVYLYLAGGKDGEGTVRRVSVSTDGIEGNKASVQPLVSHEGRFVAFRSDATNLVKSGGRSNWYVADTTDDTIVALPEFDVVNGFIGPTEVLGQNNKSGQAVIRSLPEGETRLFSMPARVRNEQPVAIRIGGKRLFYVTGDPLDEERDTNNQPDLYVVDLPDSMINLAKPRGENAQPKKVVEAVKPKDETARTSPSVSRPEAGRARSKPNGKALGEETLKRVAGEYELSGKDATGGETKMSLVIKSDGTASLDAAKKAGVESLAVTGQDAGQFMTLTVSGKTDKVDVNLTMIMLGGGDPTCIYVEKGDDGSSKLFQMTAKKKGSEK